MAPFFTGISGAIKGQAGFGLGRKIIKRNFRYLIYYSPATVNLTNFGNFQSVQVLKISSGNAGSPGAPGTPGGGGVGGSGGSTGVISYQNSLPGPYTSVSITTDPSTSYPQVIGGPFAAPGSFETIPGPVASQFPGLSFSGGAGGIMGNEGTHIPPYWDNRWTGDGGFGGAGGMIVTQSPQSFPEMIANATSIGNTSGSTGSTGGTVSASMTRTGGTGGTGGIGYGAGGGGGGGGSEVDRNTSAGGAGGAGSPGIIIIKLQF